VVRCGGVLVVEVVVVMVVVMVVYTSMHAYMCTTPLTFCV